ncbi:hypothetical protein E3N88_09483 [Mikania micrantha]|uniref:Uncharacterized protein n=1 Tax=Mikania micrantha TaxID=192012 RepID=A0A5N6PK25_9ASTR|nr:hypothetical protein E3N88_09483 [Mikania micrantha]
METLKYSSPPPILNYNLKRLWPLELKGDGTFGDLRPKLIEMEVFDQCRLFVLLQHGFPFSIVPMVCPQEIQWEQRMRLRKRLSRKEIIKE